MLRNHSGKSKKQPTTNQIARSQKQAERCFFPDLALMFSVEQHIGIYEPAQSSAHAIARHELPLAFLLVLLMPLALKKLMSVGCSANPSLANPLALLHFAT